MTARILVVNHVPANVRLLEARLLAEYFEVLTATNGADAIEICENGKVDVVLLDVMMPGMDGFEVCRRLKADRSTSHVTVVMVTALDQVSDRIRGLEAGADDFLTKPVNDLQLLTRVRSLVRLKMLTDELRLRASTTRNIGIEELLGRKDPMGEVRARVLLVDQRASSQRRISDMLLPLADVDVMPDPQAALFQAADGRYEGVVISTGLAGFDPLRLCSQLRSLDRTRFLPIILLVEPGEDHLVMRGLDLGVNDYLMRPIDEQELTARLRTQIRRKRYNEELRSSVAETIDMAVMDSLTGLHNRRYFDTHMPTLFDRAIARNHSLSIIFIDLDMLRAVNDYHGHSAGSDVLRQCGQRLRGQIRAIDMACIYGGDEFVVVLPNVGHDVAIMIAEKIRKSMEESPFKLGNECNKISVTISAGVSSLRESDTPASLLYRADMALYKAKRSGRNRVYTDV